MTHTKGKLIAKFRTGAGWELFGEVGAHDFWEYRSTSDDFQAPILQGIKFACEPWHQFPQKKWEELIKANMERITHCWNNFDSLEATNTELLEALKFAAEHSTGKIKSDFDKIIKKATS